MFLYCIKYNHRFFNFIFRLCCASINGAGMICSVTIKYQMLSKFIVTVAYYSKRQYKRLSFIISLGYQGPLLT